MSLEMLDIVSGGDQVLLVWSDLGSSAADSLTALVTSLQQRVGQHGRYQYR